MDRAHGIEHRDGLAAGHDLRRKVDGRVLADERHALLDEVVDNAIVTKFVNLIGEKGPQMRLLNFFTAICSPHISQHLKEIG